MDARFRHHYRDYQYNRYPEPVKEGFTPIGRLPSFMCDLDNDIHPLFRPTNFPGANYEALRPALQIASLLIDTDCLLDFWHAIFFGERRRVHEDDGDKLCDVAFYRRRGGLSAKDRAATRLKLQTLSQMFRFYRDATLGGMDAACEYLRGRSLSSLSDVGTFQYRIRSVTYSDAGHQQICHLFEAGIHLRKGDEGVGSLPRRYIDFATKLVHEVAHAAVQAELGDNRVYFFEGSMVDEHGFAWESHVFGGLLDISNDLERPVMITPWPTPSVVNGYLRDGDPIVARQSCASIQAVFFVPMGCIARLLTTRFWTHVRAIGASALKPQTTEGIRVEVGQDGDLSLFSLCIQDADRFDGVPEQWYAIDEKIYPIDSSDHIDAGGLGRLMRINWEGIQADDRRPHYDQDLHVVTDGSCDSVTSWSNSPTADI